MLERQINHMVRIVDDLLDVSRITQGKVELRKESVELRSIVNAAVELSRPLIDAARHEITVSLPNETIRLNADPVRLTQVLINLLNNAVKFTPDGRAHLVDRRDDRRHGRRSRVDVRIRVRDTGVGIAPEALPHVFDMFMQGDRSLEKTRGGLGVGLTLVRDLVALHGGSVQARSDGPGTGSEFIVTLPLDPTASCRSAGWRTATMPAIAARLYGSSSRTTTTTDARCSRCFCKQKGHTVATAADGTQALEAVGDFQPGCRAARCRHAGTERL